VKAPLEILEEQPKEEPPQEMALPVMMGPPERLLAPPVVIVHLELALPMVVVPLVEVPLHEEVPLDKEVLPFFPLLCGRSSEWSNLTIITEFKLKVLQYSFADTQTCGNCGSH
jgi:hypothetical protein